MPVRDKQEIRERVWALLTERRVARFPLPLHDRIPNFAGAELAARRLAETPEWKAARRLKCNPDAPQRAVRLQALREGKLLFMAVSRLREARCFLRLDPTKLGGKLAKAATISGAATLGEPVEPKSLGMIDLVIAGSVAVSPDGARVGRAAGTATSSSPWPASSPRWAKRPRWRRRSTSFRFTTSSFR